MGSKKKKSSKNKASSDERSSSRKLSNPRNMVRSPVYNIKILVVDDDSTSLAIVSAMLRDFHYRVTSVKTPMAALKILRTNASDFDLVVTDLHMPEMNGIQLQRKITRHYKLPVIIMSSDDDESVMLESLAGGAVFYIVKPIDPDGLKNVWQYAVSAKNKGKSVLIEDLDGEGEFEAAAGEKLLLGNMRSRPSVNNDREGRKRKSSPSKGKDDSDREVTKKQPPKKKRKPKVLWTNELHNQFLEALKFIGFEKAVPKKILEYMKVPNLTRENVASHLQKYRVFLKRITERGGSASKAILERLLKSNFAVGHPYLLKTAQEYARIHEVERMRNLAFGDHGVSPHSNAAATRYGTFGYGTDVASSSNLAPPPQQYGGGTYGQSSLLSNQANRPLLMNNQPFQGNANRLGLGNGSNLPLNGGFSSSSQFRLGSPGLLSSSSALGNGMFGSTRSSHPSVNPGYANNTNSYAGISSSPDRRLLGMTSGTHYMNVASTMGDQNFPYMAQGGFSNPAFTASNQQANATALTGGIRNLILDDYDHPVNNAPNLGNPNNQQLGSEGYLRGFIHESNQQQRQHQQQAGEAGVENPEFSFGSFSPEIYPSLDELLNREFSESSEDAVPFSEEDVGQVQTALERLLRPNNTADGDANPSDGSDLTELNQNTNQQQSEGGVQWADSDSLGGISQENDAPAPAPAPAPPASAPASASAEDDSSDNIQDSEDDDHFFENIFNFDDDYV